MEKAKFIIVITAVILLISGCTISFGGSSNISGTANDGGIYKSINKGSTWQQKVLIPSLSGTPKSIATIDTNTMVFDPSDNQAIYLTSQDNGLFYTYDAADSWQIATDLGKVTVKAVAVDPSSKCTIYATIGNKVYKSTDCSRSWEQSYYDNDPQLKINALVVDGINGANVYIGTSRGEIIKSSDRGASWQTLQRFNDSVEKIIVSPFDSKIIFIATLNKGLFRSTDGPTWQSLSNNLKEFNDSSKFRDLTLAKSEKGLLFFATNYGLIKSMDNGDSWKEIKLITPEKGAIINSIAVNPQNAKEIYYSTNTTFYRSLDGGVNWSSKKLPTARAGWKILIDPVNTSIIYLGAKKANR